MRTWAVAAVVILVAACQAADEPKLELKEFTHKRIGCKLMLPGEPKVTRDVEGDGQDDFVVATAAGSGRSFTVQFHRAYFGKMTANEAAKLLAKQPVPGKDAKVSSDKELAVGQAKWPGREFLVEATAGEFTRRRLFLVDGWMFAVEAVGPKAFVTSQDADAVFDSLDIPNR